MKISLRPLLFSLLFSAAVPFAFAADDPAPSQQELPPEVLKALFPEASPEDLARADAEAFLRMARRAPAGESRAQM